MMMSDAGMRLRSAGREFGTADGRGMGQMHRAHGPMTPRTLRISSAWRQAEILCGLNPRIT
jgi:hypothetical protein